MVGVGGPIRLFERLAQPSDTTAEELLAHPLVRFPWFDSIT
jgi:hypothetical protein